MISMERIRCKSMGITYRVIREYTIKQLSEKARQHAIEHYRNNMSGDDAQINFDCTMEYVIEQLDQKGWGKLDSKDTDYEIGGYNGGDYFRFHSNSIDLKKLAKTYSIPEEEYHIENLARLNDIISISKEHNVSSNWPSENFTDYLDEDAANLWLGCKCMRIETYRIDRISERWTDKLVELLQDLYKDECHAMKKELLESWEAASEDESIIENIEANDYVFDEDGDIL